MCPDLGSRALTVLLSLPLAFSEFLSPSHRYSNAGMLFLAGLSMRRPRPMVSGAVRAADEKDLTSMVSCDVHIMITCRYYGYLYSIRTEKPEVPQYAMRIPCIHHTQRGKSHLLTMNAS